MYLAINDMVQHKETKKIYRVQKIDNKQIVLQPHTLSLTKYIKGNSKALTNNSSRQYNKVIINRLGKVV